MNWPFGKLQMFGYEVVVADPPWEFELRSEKGIEKSPQRYYETMPVAEIKALPVANLVRHNSLLLLWTTGWAIATGQAQDVARAWGRRAGHRAGVDQAYKERQEPCRYRLSCAHDARADLAGQVGQSEACAVPILLRRACPPTF